MNPRSSLWLSLLGTLAATLGAKAAPLPTDAAPKYRLLRKIPLKGETGWDYLSLDAAARRLYVTRGIGITVLDVDRGEVVGEIADTPGVHGVALAPDLGRGFTSNGRDDSVTIFDLKTLATLGKAKTGANPDAIIYEPVTRRVFVFNGRGQSATVLEGASGQVAGEIPVGGKPEFAAVDGAGRVFVNVEDTNELLAIDAKTMRIAARWPLGPGVEPTGLAIDRAHKRLFAGCHNQLLVAVDAESGRVVATAPIGKGVDAVEYDPETATVLTSNGSEGTLTVIHQDAPDAYRVTDNAATQKSGRTMALDSKTHHVFVIAASFGPPPSPSPGTSTPRPPITPGSVVLFEMEPSS